jgi:hypothetical protein
MSYIHLAIPAFFALIAIELVAARLLERDVSRLADSVADLSCGILQQLLEVFLKTALFAGYAWLYSAHRLFEVEAADAWSTSSGSTRVSSGGSAPSSGSSTRRPTTASTTRATRATSTATTAGR